MDAATTDACLDILDGAQLRAPVLESILAAIQMHLDRRAGGAFRVARACSPTSTAAWARQKRQRS